MISTACKGYWVEDRDRYKIVDPAARETRWIRSDTTLPLAK